MYPLKFKNIYYEKIWGGRSLEAYRKNMPEGKIGESWDVACHKNGTSIVANGKYKGKDIYELSLEAGELILGSKIIKSNFKKEDFPLLVKIINSNDNLSVQVHPDNEYALSHEGDNGKLEAWYILSSEPGAHIVLGLDKCDKETFVDACKSGTIERYMNTIPVRPGELYLIEPGTLHSIGKGIMLIEFQQNSDVTYRVYDYGRGRELNLSKALDVLNFGSKPMPVMGNVNRKGLNIEFLNINGKTIGTSDETRFSILTVIEGKGTIKYLNHGVKEKLEINTLETILIPASLGEYLIEGDLKIAKCFP